MSLVGWISLAVLVVYLSGGLLEVRKKGNGK